jgi:D-hydroxyproline dehydrogenase subunit beta
MQADVVIIGAGIIGTSCAYFLAKGGLRVVIVERGGVASGTSGAGEGNILVSDKTPGPELELARHGRVLWENLARELPDDFEFEPKGGVVVAGSEANLPSLLGSLRELQGANIEAYQLDTQQIRDLEPHLAHDIAGATFFPQDAQVQPMLACAAFAKAAVRHGAQLLSHTAVFGIKTDAAGVTEVLTTRGEIATRTVINAAGPWSREIAKLVRIELDVQPRKGHILVTEPLPKLVHHKVFEASYADTVNNPTEGVQVASVVEGTQSGTILLGSSRQLVGFDAAIDIAVVKLIAARAIRYFPVLAKVNALRAYAGFRAFTPDHLPIVGEHASVKGFYTITGHEGAGIGTGPMTSLLLAQKILGQPTALDMLPFAADRFLKVHSH